MIHPATNISELRTLTAQISDALGMAIDEKNIADVSGKINLLTMLLGAASQAAAGAEMMYNNKVLDLRNGAPGRSHTDADKAIVYAGVAARQKYYATVTEYQYRGLLYAIDALKVILGSLGSEPLY